MLQLAALKSEIPCCAKFLDGIAGDANIGMIKRPGRHIIHETVIGACRIDLVDANIDGACICAQVIEGAVPDIIVRDPQVAAVKPIVP